MRTQICVGIDAISFYCPHYFLDLRSLAGKRGVDVDTFYKGIGQEKMAIPPPGEDVITMAANAGDKIVSHRQIQNINTLIFATESGIDQSKAGGIYIHNLLGLPSQCRVFEVKQACYGATAALQLALPLIRQNPLQKVLIIASDIARYGLETPGEQTQGGGAVAMLISANPRLMMIEEETGIYTEDVMDFWRPNYRDEALVDGKVSIRVYIRSLLETFRQYQRKTGRDFSFFDRFCYHLPFTKMAEKAHKKLALATNASVSEAQLLEQISDSLVYNRMIGNSYAASMYIGIASLLDCSSRDLGGKHVGLFSYGSGCMAEFFSGTVCRGYQEHIYQDHHQKMLKDRYELSYSDYEKFYKFSLPSDGSEFPVPKFTTGNFRLSAIKAHKRIYEKLHQDTNIHQVEEKLYASLC